MILPARSNELRGRFAYFGQTRPYKGLHVLLEALGLLPESRRSEIHLSIHGSGLETQAGEYRQLLHKLSKRLGDTVSFEGEYEPKDQPKLMQNVGWVVVPSIWWENSPLVIQEAFTHGRPVICSDIGGMAEKVEDGKSGLHFRTADAKNLAETIEKAACQVGTWESLVVGVRKPPSLEQIAEQHWRVYTAQADSPIVRLSTHESGRQVLS